MNLAGYETSRDYAKLWDLAQRQSVVCVVDYEVCGEQTRDIASTVWGDGAMFVSARGICYVHAFAEEGEARFVAGCAAVDLEWIVPPTLDGLTLNQLVAEVDRRYGKLITQARGGKP